MISLFNEIDISPLYQLIQETIDYSYCDIYPDRAVDFFKNHHSEKAILERSRAGETFLIKKRETIVATGTVIENEISGVFVTPASQGAGFGRKIMQKLEKQIQSKGFDKIILDISLPSREFYEKLHYRISEECSFEVGEGQFLKYWKGVKTIQRHAPTGDTTGFVKRW